MMFHSNSLKIQERPSHAALGAIELRSIAQGVFTLDAILKESPIQVLLACASSPGKYLILMSGEVDELIRAMTIGVEYASDELLDDLLLPAACDELWNALCEGSQASLSTSAEMPATGMSAMGLSAMGLPALGILECFGAPALLGALDTAAKTGAVNIQQIHLLQGIGGKATGLISGDVESVQIAIDAGSEHAIDRNLLAKSLVIPRPSSEILEHLLQSGC